MNYEFIQTGLSNVCTVIITIISYQYFYSCFFENKKWNQILKRALFAGISVLFWCSLQFVEDRTLNLFILLSCTFIVSLLYKMKWYNNILFTFIFYAISSLCEVIVASLTMVVFQVEYADLRKGIFLFAGMLLSKFFSFAIFAVFKLKKHHYLFGKHKQSWIIVFLLPITTVLVVLGQINFMRFQTESSPLQILVIFSMIGLIFCNHYVFRFIDTIWQITEKDNQLAVADNLLIEQEKQYEALVKNHNEIAKIHHDYKNILIGLHSDLINEKIEDAKRHIENQLALVSLTNNTISGNHVIDTIINNKLALAQSLNIEMDFQFRNLRNIQIDSIDIAVLLGNALDNAIEATVKTSGDKQRKITLIIVLKNDILNIIIENPVEKDVDTDNLETNKKDKRFHGYGIINMRTIVNRYEGSILLTCQNNIFGTTIRLSNNSLISTSIDKK